MSTTASIPHPSGENRPPSVATLSYQVDGLQAEASIRVDPWGVPHIRAGSARDAYFVQGFNAARDRLWQIDLWRKRGLGLLAESFGPGYLMQDRAARLFLYRGDMALEWAAYGTPDTQAIATAFAAGINAYIALTEADPTLLPPEFATTGSTPKLWQPGDVVRIRSHALGRNLPSEFARARLLAEGGDLALDLARRSIDPPHRVVVPEGLDVADINARALDVFHLAVAPVSFSPERLAAPLAQAGAWSRLDALGEVILDPAAEGSNNWVVSAARSASGRPIMASDPHRAYTLPSTRYVAHLSAPGLDVIGAGEASLPGISLGHNASAAFSLTTFPVDQEDLYVYETHPDDPDLYRYQGQWERMQTVDETCAVKGEAAQALTLKFTRHGPVIHEDRARLRACAVRTVWTEPGSAPYLASLAYQAVDSIAQFGHALESWSVPTNNHVYADIHGDFGWLTAGKAPVRRNWDGLLPVPGDGRYEWDGYYASTFLPRSINPVSGFVSSANDMNLPAGPVRELGLGYEWNEPFRGERIREVLQRDYWQDLASAAALQGDELSIPARRLGRLLVGLEGTNRDAGKRDGVVVRDGATRAAGEHDSAEFNVAKRDRAERDMAERDTAAALDLLRGWDHRLTAGSAAALLFEIWWMKHLKPALLDRLSRAPALRALIGPGDHETLLDGLETPSALFGVGQEDERAACLTATLAQALAECRQRFGADPAAWRWSALHHGYFAHPLSKLGDAALSDIGPLPLSGSGSTVLNTNYRLADGRANIGASFRMLLDVGAWDNCRFINAPGQSGDPRSPHYADHAPDWAEKNYFPLLYSAAAVDAATALHILLTPASASD